ncbi:MAG: hypothetical protein Q8Q09_04040 [Deltaproteobacteria bacterium]|nr:hypothetical protein [Deltaproteobacteria bacterium]
MSLIVLVLLSLVAPVLVLSGMLEKHKLVWLPRARHVSEEASVGEGAFRQGNAQQSHWSIIGGGLPTSIVVVAFFAFFIGQMLVPAIPAAILGILFSTDHHTGTWWIQTLALSSITGVYCAVLTFRAGLALVRGRREQAQKLITSNTRWTLTQNTILCAAAAYALMTRPREYEFAYATLAYASAVVLHLFAMRHVFYKHIERYTADDVHTHLLGPGSELLPESTFVSAPQFRKV